MDDLLNALDEQVQQSPPVNANGRRSVRRPFRVGCLVRFFAPGRKSILEVSGRTRNLSRSGVGLLTRQVFHLGEPIELHIDLPGRPVTYLAGSVRFCRPVSGGYNEIGAELKTSTGESILDRCLLSDADIPDWL